MNTEIQEDFNHFRSVYDAEDFDVCEAFYLYGMNHHEGQGSKAYSMMGFVLNMGFKPSPLFSERSISETARMIYQDLIGE